MKKQEAQSVGEIISRILSEQKLDIKLNETRLIKSWNTLLGEYVAGYTSKLYIHNRVLYVQLSSAVLRQELSMCRNMLIQKLNNHIGTEVITDIIFR
ncbi:MAG: DUF721 domain-containing protein [Coprobacter sp.]|nr:DUF721 domain-containing protein [Coprobacter sp.]